MKRLLLLMILMLSGFGWAQEQQQIQLEKAIPRLIVKKEGIMPIVVEVDNIKASELYERALNWVQEAYKNPDKVIKAKAKDRKIRLEGYIPLAFVGKVWLNIGTQNYDMDYELEISFKDDKYKFFIFPKTFTVVVSGQGRGNWPVFLPDLFKKDGEPKKHYRESIPMLENTVNTLHLYFYDYVTNKIKEKENW